MKLAPDNYKFMDTVWILLRTLIATYLILVIFGWLIANKLIFPAPSPSYPKEGTPGFFYLTTENGLKVTATHLSNEKTTHTLLYFHGNGEDLGYCLPTLQALQQNGWDVLAVDYPGYGQSAGKPTEKNTYAAAQALYDYATGELKLPPEELVLYGRSLGGGPAFWLAEREPVAGVITEGTFTSTFRVMTFSRILPWDKFDNLARVDKIGVPLLVIHGMKDRTIPFSHGEKLYATAESPKYRLWVEEAGHNYLVDVAGAKYWDALESFRNSLLTQSPQNDKTHPDDTH